MYAGIDQIAGRELSTAAVCTTLDISRSAYYAWRSGAATPRVAGDEELAPLVRAVFWQHRRRYGARRIASELADRGQRTSPRRVAKLLKTQGLRAIQPKSFVPHTTDSRHRLGYSPNLLLETPEPTRSDELWVGDITYVPLRGGAFCYLALLMDRFSRALMGWRLDETMTDELTLGALRLASGTASGSYFDYSVVQSICGATTYISCSLRQHVADREAEHGLALALSGWPV